ncbi:hypothetical protein PanWU01x14_322400, partial [Parasponia andersonii]
LIAILQEHIRKEKHLLKQKKSIQKGDKSPHCFNKKQKRPLHEEELAPSSPALFVSSFQLCTSSTTSSPRMEKSKSGCSQNMLKMMVDEAISLALSSSSLTSVALNSSMAL